MHYVKVRVFCMLEDYIPYISSNHVSATKMKLLEENTIWYAETIASYYFLKDIERIAFVHLYLFANKWNSFKPNSQQKWYMQHGFIKSWISVSLKTFW